MEGKLRPGCKKKKKKRIEKKDAERKNECVFMEFCEVKFGV